QTLKPPRLSVRLALGGMSAHERLRPLDRLFGRGRLVPLSVDAPSGLPRTISAGVVQDVQRYGLLVLHGEPLSRFGTAGQTVRRSDGWAQVRVGSAVDVRPEQRHQAGTGPRFDSDSFGDPATVPYCVAVG